RGLAPRALDGRRRGAGHRSMMQSCRKMTRQMISQEQEHSLQGWAWLTLRRVAMITVRDGG
ncbi:MAG TPA: hypothetical protein PLO69_06810, partial [Gammaproteobacteria bacterium]|nr:hypothetical protein [Gammaproteobacteria bacterium]